MELVQSGHGGANLSRQKAANLGAILDTFGLLLALGPGDKQARPDVQPRLSLSLSAPQQAQERWGEREESAGEEERERERERKEGAEGRRVEEREKVRSCFHS